MPIKIYAPQNCNGLFASKFNLEQIDFSNFDTTNVQDMSEMFAYCKKLKNINLSGFNFCSVQNMNAMFKGCKLLKSINFTSTIPSVQDMSEMFFDCLDLTQVTFGESVNGVKNLSNLFCNCEKLRQVLLDNIKTSNVTNFDKVFFNCVSLEELNILDWSFASLVSIQDFFGECAHLLTIEINVSTLGNKVIELPRTYMLGEEYVDEISKSQASLGNKYVALNVLPQDWFSYATRVIGPFNPTEINFVYDDEEITDENKIVDKIGFRYEPTERILDIFSDTIIISPETMYEFIPQNSLWLRYVRFDNFKLNKSVTSLSRLYAGNNNNSATPVHLTINFGEYFDTKYVTDMSEMFYNSSRLTYVNFGARFTTSNVKNMSKMFIGCRWLEKLDLSNFDTSKVTNMSYMFSGCTSLKTLDISSFNTQNVTNMQQMFGECQSLTSLNLKHFNTKKVNTMQYMFGGCYKLEYLNISSFDTSMVTDMGGMFSGNYSMLYHNLSHFDTSSVCDMESMFSGNSLLESLSLSNFNTSNVTDMSYMFSDCTNLKNLDISSFDTSSVEYMSGMFCSCTSLKNIDISSFCLDSCKDMSEMFAYNPNLESVNLSNIDTSGVENFGDMFYECYTLKNIIGIEDLNTSNAKYLSYMFYNNFCLESLDLGRWNTKNVQHISGIFNMKCYDEEYVAISNLTYLDISGWELDSIDPKYGASDVFLECNRLETIILPYFICGHKIDLPSNFYVVDFTDIDKESEIKYNILIESSYDKVVFQKCGTKYESALPNAGICTQNNYTILYYTLTFVVIAYILCYNIKKTRRKR